MIGSYKVEVKFYNKKPSKLVNSRKDYENFSLWIERMEKAFPKYVRGSLYTYYKPIVDDLKYFLQNWAEELGLKKYIQDFEIVIAPPFGSNIYGIIKVGIKFAE